MRVGPTAFGLAHRVESEEPSKPMPPGFPSEARHKQSLCLLFAMGGSGKLTASEFSRPPFRLSAPPPRAPVPPTGAVTANTHQASGSTRIHLLPVAIDDFTQHQRRPVELHFVAGTERQDAHVALFCPRRWIPSVPKISLIGLQILNQVP